MTIIRVKDLSLRTFIGFKPHEKKYKQDVIIQIEVEVDSSTSSWPPHVFAQLCQPLVLDDDSFVRLLSPPNGGEAKIDEEEGGA